MNLSANFALEEMLRSQTALRLGIENTPSDAQVLELKRLCDTLLEPARLLFGVPLQVDSGYRSVSSYVRGGLNRRTADVGSRFVQFKVRRSPTLHGQC